MNIVVTGATGHMGPHVVARLVKDGHRVVAASRAGVVPAAPFGEAAPAGVIPLALDLRRDEVVEALASALGEGGALVHLGGWHPPATAASSVDDRRELIEVNVLGTMRVYEAARRARAQAVVYASTFEVYGDIDDALITEQSRVRPITDYGASKLAGEDHLHALTLEDGIRGVSLRMPAIYGPGEHTPRALPNFLRAVAAGQRPRIAGDGLDQRDLLHVRDSAHAVSLALSYGGSGIFNIADGEAHTIAEMATLAMRLGGLEGSPEVVERQKQRRDYHMSIEQARRELGYEPQVRLADGAAEQLAWLRASGHGVAS